MYATICHRTTYAQGARGRPHVAAARRGNRRRDLSRREPEGLILIGGLAEVIEPGRVGADVPGPFAAAGAAPPRVRAARESCDMSSNGNV